MQYNKYITNSTRNTLTQTSNERPQSLLVPLEEICKRVLHMYAINNFKVIY